MHRSWPSPLLLAPYALHPKLAGCQEAVFELGERRKVLAQLDKEAVVPHMAEAEGKKLPYEVRG